MGLQGVIILQFYYVCTLKQERKFKIFEDGAKVKKNSEIKTPLVNCLFTIFLLNIKANNEHQG